MREKLKVLDLFSGIGGFSLGLERTGGFETVAFCEIDPFCQKVLKKNWPDVPIYNDVRTLDHDGPIDVITGGYPCQPFSTAGKRKGADDDRHLWPAMFRLVQKHRPAWVIGENVAGHISMGLDNVLADLEGEGYAARAFVIPACAVDAPHRRDRVWVVAHSQSAGKRREVGNIREKDGGQGRTLLQQPDGASEGAAKIMADAQGFGGGAFGQEVNEPQRANGFSGSGERIHSNADSAGREKFDTPSLAAREGHGSRTSFEGRPAARWTAEPAVGRVAHGIPRRVDRLKSLGNAVVPKIPEMIGYGLLWSMDHDHIGGPG